MKETKSDILKKVLQETCDAYGITVKNVWWDGAFGITCFGGWNADVIQDDVEYCISLGVNFEKAILLIKNYETTPRVCDNLKEFFEELPF
ncbi:MAG: hypothetical protein ABL951_04105 [Alphaproteobacteria bacterium]